MGKIEEFDGATAALNAFHLADDKANKNYETFGARVIEDLIAELMEGHAVTTVRGIKVDLAFILDDCALICDGEVAAMICMTKEERNDRWLLVEQQAKTIVKQWVTDSDIAAAVISERVRDRVLEASEV